MFTMRLGVAEGEISQHIGSSWSLLILSHTFVGGCLTASWIVLVAITCYSFLTTRPVSPLTRPHSCALLFYGPSLTANPPLGLLSFLRLLLMFQGLSVSPPPPPTGTDLNQ